MGLTVTTDQTMIDGSDFKVAQLESKISNFPLEIVELSVYNHGTIDALIPGFGLRRKEI